ncbi:antibiotic biosynthesis monooxygenase [Flavobacteriaceae bacterium GSB9]|nr:antibiotic biosynthesis monooxygenase [Flavobacteriaceae bacterium GSB9]
MGKKSKIIRTWKGWTTIENAPIYEDMLINEIFPSVKKKGVDGLEKVSISTRQIDAEMEFFLVLRFDSLESVKKFAGENYKKAYIPDNAKEVLKRYDKTAEHYKLKGELILKVTKE